MTIAELMYLVGALVVGVLLVTVVRRRRVSHARHVQELANEEVCPHLGEALRHLLERGHTVVRVGQKQPDMPLEIHVTPRFDPRALYEELKLQEPVLVSERNVLYCKEDWCELHPTT